MPPFVVFRTLFLSPSTKNSAARNFSTKTNHRNFPTRQALRQNLDKHRRRVPIYLFSFAAFASLNIFGAYIHTDDDYFPYYPFPFALDVGHGPSMLPTITNGAQGGGNLYLRDCWSHRFVWLDLEHLKNCITKSLSDPSKLQNVSLKRPWQKGDVVTLYNPITTGLVTKRIIGVGGDSIQVFGEYAHDYHSAMEDGDKNHGNVENDCGVPRDARFPAPFCQRMTLDREREMDDDSKNQPLKRHHETTIIVPPNHVWLEGDNPLHSTDSRHYGPLPESALRGRILLRIWPMSCQCYSPNRRDEKRIHEECACSAILDSKRPAPLENNGWLEDA